MGATVANWKGGKVRYEASRVGGRSSGRRVRVLGSSRVRVRGSSRVQVGLNRKQCGSTRGEKAEGTRKRQKNRGWQRATGKSSTLSSCAWLRSFLDGTRKQLLPGSCGGPGGSTSGQSKSKATPTTEDPYLLHREARKTASRRRSDDETRLAQR